MRLHLILFWMLFLVCFTSNASPRLTNPVFQSLSTKNGLPQDIVNDICIANDGFIWIATEGGLARWDGVRAKQISGPDNIFFDTAIYKITLEGNEAVWISTYSNGIYRLDLETQHVELIIDIPFSNYSDWSQNAESFFWKSEHELVIALPEVVLMYDTETKKTTELAAFSEELIEQTHLIRFAMMVDDVLIMATTDGVFTVDTTSKKRELNRLDYLAGTPKDDDNNNAKFLTLDDKDRLWIATVNGVFKTSKAHFLAHIHGAAQPSFERVISGKNVWTMRDAGEDSFWLGTNRGLALLQKKDNTWIFEHILEPHNGRTELSDKRIKALQVDNAGNLWLSSIYGGALHFGVKSADIFSIQNSRYNEERALSDGVVWALAQTEPDTLWIGTENGLNRYNFKTDKTEQYLTKESSNITEGEALIQRVVPAGGGKLFLQTYMGIRLFNPDDETLSIPPLVDPTQNDIFDVWSSSIVGSDEGDLYFIGNEFYRYRMATQKIETLALDKEIFDVGFSIGFLGQSAYHDNRMFLAMGGGLWLVDIKTFEHELVYRFSESQRSMDRSISSWVIDDLGVLWLAYSGFGLIGVDADTFEPLYNLNESNLLMSNIVYGLEKDENGDIWFSSHNGLHRYSPLSGQVKNFIYGRELSVSEFNQGAALKLHDGTLVYGSTSGVVIFEPATLAKTFRSDASDVNQTAITEVSVDSRLLPQPLTNLNGKTVNLNHDDYGLTVYFSALAMNSVGNVKYHYKLTRDSDIVSEGVTTDNKLTLASLSPGMYEFSVGPTPGSFENAILPAALTIEMPYAPWRSPLAYGIYSLLIASALLAFFLSRQRQLHRLQSAQREVALFSDAFKQTRDWVIIFDSKQEPVAANPAFEKVFGFNQKERLSKQLNRLYMRYPFLNRQLSGKLKELKPGEFWKDEAVVEGRDGNNYDVLIDVTAASDGAGGVEHYLIVISDITEQKNAEKKLLKIANYDSLTGLVNRSLLLDRLEHAIGHARQHNNKVAVMFIDLDRFKGINDSLGHDYGDKLLRVVANRMRNLVADAGTVARLGGDEFVIVIEDVENTESLTSFVGRLIESVETPIALADEVLRVSCSIGVAYYPDDAAEPAELIKQADVAMYTAKKDTLNGFAFFTQDMNERARQQLNIENVVKRAYLESCFFNHYQPIVNASKGKTVGVELLLRGELDGKALYPDAFIPILEQLRHIIDVTRLAMRRAAEDLSFWYEQGFTGFVSINLSALHFKTEFDLEGVLALLNEFNLPKEAFRFEITEGVLMDDSDNALRQINRFVDAGFILALDDFGTGYSSMSYLKRYPLSVLKIDKSFVHDMAPGNANEALVSTTITLATSLKMQSVAEGVETQEQATSLLNRGCEYHQGYFYSRPVASENVLPLLFKKW